MNGNLNTITCPNCGTEINVESILYSQAETRVKTDLEKQIKQQQTIYFQQRQSLEKDIEEFNQKKLRENELFQDKINKVKQELEKQMLEKASSEFQLEMKMLKDENEQRKAENFTLKSKELEFLKKEKEFKEKEEEFRLIVEKELLERSKLIEEKAKENTEKHLDLMLQKNNEQIEEIKKNYQFELKQLQVQLEQQKKLAEEMQKRAGQGSMQLQGEVQEIILEELLMKIYPQDIIEPVPKGFTGADVIQLVYNDFRNECGKIIYESKRTKNFSEEWIQKLKDDQMSAKASIAILVSDILPKDMDRFGEKNGVWICTFNEVRQVSFILREMIVKEFSMMESQKNSGDKMLMLYNYLTSSDFKQRIDNILDAFYSMKKDLEKEKRAFARIWKEREIQIERVITNTIQLHGTFTGIAGNSIPALESLNLIDDESNFLED